MRLAIFSFVCAIGACNAIDGADQYSTSDASGGDASDAAACTASCIDTSGSCLAACKATLDSCTSGSCNAGCQNKCNSSYSACTSACVNACTSCSCTQTDCENAPQPEAGTDAADAGAD